MCVGMFIAPNLLKNIIEASQALPFLCYAFFVRSHSVCHIEAIFGDLFEQTIVYSFQFIFSIEWLRTRDGKKEMTLFVHIRLDPIQFDHINTYMLC